MKTNPRPIRLIPCVFACLLPATLAFGQTNYPIKLNANLVAGGDVGRITGFYPGFEISPDGARVAYHADQDTDDVEELYSVPMLGGVPVKLNGTMVAGGDVRDDFQFSPDNSLVVYLADQDTDEVVELYSVPAAGGPATKLNGLLASGGNVSAGISTQVPFKISPDGNRVVYMADQDSDEVFELYSVPIAGGATTKLNGTLPAGGNVYGFAITPDGSRVVYIATQDTAGVFELYSVPLSGGPPVKLNSTLASGGGVYNFRFSPDGSRTVYWSDQETDEVYEIFSVATTGGTPVKLNGALVAGGDVGQLSEFHPGFVISPDGARVVYQADQAVDGVKELYSVRILGGAAVKLSGTMVAGGDVLDDFLITADGGRVVYHADQDTDGVLELYSVSISGGAAVKLNGALATGGNVAAGVSPQTPFEISPDGNRVVYMGDQDTDEVYELYSVSILGGTATRLNGALPAGGNVFGFAIAPTDGIRVNYISSQDITDVLELYSVPLSGGSRYKLNDTLGSGGGVYGFRFSPHGSRTVYWSDQEVDDTYELFVGRIQAAWTAIGGNWHAAANWSGGVIPDEAGEALIKGPAVVGLQGDDAPVVIDSLFLGGSSGNAVIDLSGGAMLTIGSGVAIQARGVLQGDGIVSVGALPLALPAGAELRAREGDRFILLSGAVTNAGWIEALGTLFSHAEIEFQGAVTNVAGTGAIFAHDAILRFPQGLVNEGSLSIGSGVNDVLGDLDNGSGGLIMVSGGATALFNGDVSNSGTINVSEAGDLQSTAVFLGSLSGNGVSGGGHVFLEGDTRPGFSPGTMAFGGDLTLGPFALTEIEIAGTSHGTGHDRITVAGHLELGGILQVVLLDGFTPAAGMVFDLWDAASAGGQFGTLVLPVLPPGLFWRTATLATTGELGVALTPDSYDAFAAAYSLSGGPAGDHDGDGLANILEYLTGRDPARPDFSGSLLTVEARGRNATVRFLMAEPPGPDLLIDLEASATLLETGPGAWQAIASRAGAAPWSGPAPVTVTPAGDGRVIVAVQRDLFALPQEFYRLKVSLQP